MKYWVYVHTCPNGKKYVGTTTQDKPEYRWGNGRRYAYNDHFFKAILKYGWSNIQHEAWEVESKEEMYKQEINLIKLYQSNNPEYGYNNSLGGEKGSLGSTLSEKTRLKMSKSRKGKKRGPFPEEWRKHMSEAQKGKKKVWPKHRYLLPSGEIKTLMTSHATRFYLNKGINIIKLD